MSLRTPPSLSRAFQTIISRLRAIPLVDRQWSKELETDQERRALFLRILNRSWLAMALVALVSFFYYPAERASISLFFIFSLATFWMVRWLIQCRKTVLAGFIFTSLVNTSFFGAFLFRGLQIGFQRALTEYQYVLMMMGLAIIFAGAFIHRWAPFSLAALNSTLMLFITQALAPKVGPVLSVHSFWWLVATSVWLYETSLSIAFDKLRLARADLENQVLQRTQNLQEAIARLERTQQSLHEKNEELEAFSYSVSHDLRAPLRAIDGYAAILSEDYAPHLDEDGRRMLERVRQNIRRMDQMIQGMLFLSRLDRYPMQWQRVNLHRLARQVFDELQAQNPNQPVVFHLEELPPCLGDIILLRQALTNLLSNALKFTRTRQPAEIWFSSQVTPQGVVYCLRDNGVGFAMDQAYRLFAPFQRLHRPEEYEGSGIGLAIVQRIIQRHNGKVWAEGQEDGGATFYFMLGKPAPDDEVASSEGLENPSL